MGKYLIQDIIPPDKKRRMQKQAAAAHAGAERTHRIHAGEGDTETAHERVTEHSSPHVAGHRSEDPRTMIADQVYDAGMVEEPRSASPVPAHAKIISDTTPAYSYGDSMSAPEHPSDPRNVPPHFPSDNSSNREFFGGWITWIVGTIAVLTLGILGFNYFAGATVLLIPKHDTIPLDQTMTAYKNPASGDLGYAIMQVVLSDSREVPATGTKTVTAKASGSIVIYNEQTIAQRLIKNTRFQSPTGKIYRINESVTVPKGVMAGGKVTPGSLQVTVYADEAGPAYNTDPVDLTVPGLKDTAQYAKVYARSKGPIAGGASGIVKTVSDADMKQSGEDLRVALETKLRTKARGELASSQVAYDPGIIVAIDTPTLVSTQASADDKAVIAATGTIYMVVFDRTMLTDAIARALIPTYGGETIRIDNLDALTFAMTETQGNVLWTSDQLAFGLKGSPALTWVVDQQEIVKVLADTPKANFNTIMARYVNIERAKATLRPFWKQNFPTESKAITVQIVDKIDD